MSTDRKNVSRCLFVGLRGREKVPENLTSIIQPIWQLKDGCIHGSASAHNEPAHVARYVLQMLDTPLPRHSFHDLGPRDGSSGNEPRMARDMYSV
jgi:hypothetical protein